MDIPGINKIKLLIKRTMNNMSYKKSFPEIKKMKNLYNGERCFIIGNGPSLLLEDLGKLKKEKTFSSHRIHKIFKETEWRPTFYCAQDRKLINEDQKEIQKVSNESVVMIGKEMDFNYKTLKNTISLKLKSVDFYPNFPEFSEDISSYVIEGGTVTYMCIQIAVYMGFKEIYLLGIDHNYSVTMDANGNIQHHDGVKDHFSEDDKIVNVPVLYKSTLAYEKAKIYAEEHGVKIYNATRGGKLEVFERIDFDSLTF